jgi:rSAM/selenodomain-associated transferase 2
MITVVIPTLNEAATLPALLGDLRELGAALPVEIVVVDGGSSDDTCARAVAGGARVIEASRGRALQLNAGGAAARGDWLLFLHADCRLTANCRTALAAALEREEQLQVAVFRFAIDLPPGWKQFIEWGQAIRQAVFRLPYGDQGLLVRRSLFDAVGRYPDLPLMEDVALIRRLRRLGEIRILPASLLTSGRRHRARGILRTGLLHMVLISLYVAGVPARRLAAFRDAAPAARRVASKECSR